MKTSKVSVLLLFGFSFAVERLLSHFCKAQANAVFPFFMKTSKSLRVVVGVAVEKQNRGPKKQKKDKKDNDEDGRLEIEELLLCQKVS